MSPKKSRAGKKTPPKKVKKKSGTKKVVHHAHAHPASMPDTVPVPNRETTPFPSPSVQTQAQPAPFSPSSVGSSPSFPPSTPAPFASSLPSNTPPPSSTSIVSTSSAPLPPPSSTAPFSATPTSPSFPTSPPASTTGSEPSAPSLPAFSPRGGGGQQLPHATETFGVHTSPAAVNTITPAIPATPPIAPSGTISTLPYGLPPLSATAPSSATITYKSERKIWPTVLLCTGVLFLLGVVVFGGIRFLPCNRQAQASDWVLWSTIAPNFICTLDLSNSSDIDGATLQSRLGSFKNLTELNLSFMQLSELPLVFDRLSDLQTLHLEGNALRSLPANMTALTHVKTLDLSHNPLGSLPPLVTALSSLETLSLADTGISTLPASISNLASLTVLDLRDNHLSAIPTNISALPKLHTLYFSGNAIPPAKQKELRKNMPNMTIVFDAPPPASSSASSSLQTSSKQAQKTLTTGKTGTCNHSFSINGFGICLPSAWSVGRDSKPLAMTIVDDYGKPIATISCPMSQDGYEDWNTTTVSRTYKKNDLIRGVDLLTGTKGQAGTPQKRLTLLLHLHALNGWYGDGYKDVSASCQMESLHPERDAALFQAMYDTVF